MGDEPNRGRSREVELQASIRKLQDELAKSTAFSGNEDARMLFGHLAWIVNILNSEYGTMMRILDRLDKHDKMLEGNSNDKDSISLRDVYNAMRGWKRFRWFIGTMVFGLVCADIYKLFFVFHK
jgi:hypothetical protein